MKKLSLLFLAGLIWSCSQQTSKQQSANLSNDEILAQLKFIKEKYRPGLGEIMSGVQMHHAKLWFAVLNENWKLADYEIKEIKERFQQAADLETDRKEAGNIPMIYNNVDSVLYTIQQKDIVAFKSSFQSLTNACNNCHRTVNFGFNVVMIPTSLPVTNQDFKAQ